MKRIILIGASGHGKVVADIARLNGYEEISFLDDNIEITSCGKYPVIGTSRDYKDIDCDFFVSIGNTEVRKRLIEQLISEKKHLPTLIHPHAVIAEDALIGYGSVIMAGVVINPGAVIGNGCIINTCSSVDHDCIIGDYVHVSVGARVCGSVIIGDETWVGADATVINNISVCKKCLIGAGAVVIHNLTESGTYVGVPVKKV